MNVAVTVEHRFARTLDGAVWTQTSFAYPFWTRYLETFDHVCVVARVRDMATVPDDWKRADGEGVVFEAVPYYVGPEQYFLRRSQIQRTIRGVIQRAEASLFRVPSQLAMRTIQHLRSRQRPYAVEVVGDPYDVFAPGANSHPLRPLFRWWFSHQLRQQCRSACAGAYVTEQALQRRYPAGSAAFTTHYSSVELPESAFAAAPRPGPSGVRPLVLVTVGTLAQLYKAPEVLLDAVSICVRGGLPLTLVLVGEGKHRGELEGRAAALGIAEQVRFLGQIPAGEAVYTQLDRADLFVLPSRQEGLPRAMIEAMARGLPCIGSTVGGIPELLLADDMVPPGDVHALASKIREVATNPARMAAMSVRNMRKAKDYSEAVLRDRRCAFYRTIRESTATWLAEQGAI